jgi:hypothetical protein
MLWEWIHSDGRGMAILGLLKNGKSYYGKRMETARCYEIGNIVMVRERRHCNVIYCVIFWN